MRNTIITKPDKTRLVNILDKITEGTIKVPTFQRGFVWTEKEMLYLFDSIENGYPIGSLLFWEPQGGLEFQCYPKIGAYPVAKGSGNTQYVLDGHQRLTTLYGVLTNPKSFNIAEDDVSLKEYAIYFDLQTEEFTYLSLRRKQAQYFQIPLYRLIDAFEFADVISDILRATPTRQEAENLVRNAKKIQKKLLDYEISYIEIKGGDIREAVNIFSRVNSTGMPISEDFMLSALTYNVDTDFLLSDKISDFLDNMQKYNFDALDRGILLNCIATAKSNSKAYFDVKIEEITKDVTNFEELVKESFTSLGKAIEFMYQQLYVINPQLLPYPTQLIFIADFFRLNPNPNPEKLDKLKTWFWVTSYANYFTIYALGHQRKAFAVFREFSLDKHENGIYQPSNYRPFTVKDFDTLNFRGVRAKTLQLFMIKALMQDEPILVDNETLIYQYLFDKKDKSAENVIVTLGSKYSSYSKAKSFDVFIHNITNKSIYFLNNDIIDLCSSSNANMRLTGKSYRRADIVRHEDKFLSDSSMEKYFTNTLKKIDLPKSIFLNEDISPF